MSEEFKMQYNQAAITSFWNKLPFIFGFPLRTGPLIFMVCVVAASGLAQWVLGDFGLIFKGTLVYLGLRYGFNVLELFAKGRFEGHSVDHRLWGPEKRPAKLGLVLVIFITASVTLGNYLLDKRLAQSTAAQDAVIAQYNAAHAKEIEARRAALQEYERQLALAEAAHKRFQAAQAENASNEPDEEPSEPEQDPAAFHFDIGERPDSGPSREEILQANAPQFGDSLWFSLMPRWYWLAILLASLILPSAAIVIAMEDKFFKSLNPGLVAYFVQSMGGAYFVLWAFFLAIVGTRQAVLTAGSSLPSGLAFPIEMALATYLGLVLFALMGYMLYQFHQELHLEVDVDFDDHRQAGGAEAIAQAGSARAALQAATPDPLERKLQVLLKAGDYKEAIAEVKDQMRHAKFDPALNTRLHALYAEAGDPAATLAHGQQWLTALSRAQQSKQAVDALRKLITINPDFVVEDGDVILPTAHAALALRDPKLAFKLLKGFDKRFAQHKDMPEVFFLGAKMMSEHMQQHDKAASVIRSLLKKYPGAAIAAEAKTYLGVLESMAPSPTKNNTR